MARPEDLPLRDELAPELNRRILVIDDDELVQTGMRTTLGAAFELASARQGADGLERVRESLAAKRPYALAFVEPGPEPAHGGVEALRRILELDAELQVVICTACTGSLSQDLLGELAHIERLLILRKPCDPIEIVQLATALCARWNSVRRERASMAALRVAEAEARAYVAAMATVNRALEAAKAGSEASLVTKSGFQSRLASVLQESSTALLAAIELACEPGLDAEARRGSLETASARCGEICNTARNLLLQARLDQETLQPARVCYSPGALLNGVAARWRARAEARGLRLTSECLGVLPVAVPGDPELVAGILDMLVDNALRFTPAGSVRLTASLPLRDEDQENALLFSVADSGPGISAHAQPRIFEAFVHDAGWAARGQGGHLSLNTARRLARFLDGDLEVESTPGAGSRFHLRMPAGDLSGVEFSAYPPGPLPSAGTLQRSEELRP